MKIYKFGGASVKNAEGVKNVAGIVKNESENLVVVISAMGKITNLLETLIKAYFEKSQRKWEIFQEFKNYHLQIIDRIVWRKIKFLHQVTDFFTELEIKLKKTPSLDYNFEYDQIICFGELISTTIVSEYLNLFGH